jgi:hypothetical protein
VTDPTRPLSAMEIEAEVWRLSQRLDQQVGLVAKRSRDAATADVAWKIANAKAILRVEGATVAEREAKALLECEGEYAAHREADAVLLAAQEAGRSLRAQIDALRTLSASQRAALTYATGEGG